MLADYARVRQKTPEAQRDPAPPTLDALKTHGLLPQVMRKQIRREELDIQGRVERARTLAESEDIDGDAEDDDVESEDGGDGQLDSGDSDDDTDDVGGDADDIETMDKDALVNLLRSLGQRTDGTERSLRERAKGAAAENNARTAVQALGEKASAPIPLSKKETKKQARLDRLERAVKFSAECVEADPPATDAAELARQREFARYLNSFLQKECRERTGKVNRFHDSEVSTLNDGNAPAADEAEERQRMRERVDREYTDAQEAVPAVSPPEGYAIVETAPPADTQLERGPVCVIQMGRCASPDGKVRVVPWEGRRPGQYCAQEEETHVDAHGLVFEFGDGRGASGELRRTWDARQGRNPARPQPRRMGPNKEVGRVARYWRGVTRGLPHN